MRRGFRRGHPFFSRGVPVYWYPYYLPDYYSLTYSPPDSDYSYTDSSAAAPQSFTSNTNPAPVVVVINQGQPSLTAGSNAGYADHNYRTAAAENQQGVVTQRSEQQSSADSVRPVSPLTQAAPAASPATQADPQVRSGRPGKFVLVSWLNDGGKDVVYVQNTETSEVQKITSEPNIDNFRIVAVHPNSDPKEFEAIISNGKELTQVRFQFN